MSMGGVQTAAATGRKRVAVIGGGPVGLATLKELKEKGHDVVGFEKRPALGGVFTDAYEGLQLTSSSLLTSYGSYVGGNLERPVLWKCGEYLTYLNDFAERFDLVRHYRLGTSVQSIRRASQGRWKLRATADGQGEGNGAGANGSEPDFDHVAICCGSNLRPQFPVWADASRFDGRLCHSATVKSKEEFTGKRVLVVGMGESGSDIALMAARAGEACAISTRHGPGYVIPRCYRRLPTDLDTNRCYHSLPRPVCGRPVVRFKVRIEEAMLHGTEDRAVLRKVREINRARGVSPFHRFATKSTAFVEAIVHHGAAYRPAVAELGRDHVVFSDGSVFRCDVIVCCTGFAPEFPFLHEHEPELAGRARNSRGLYRRMIVPEVGTGIAWIGYVRPGIGSVPACAEMQARYFAQLVSGERSLPSRSEMASDIRLHAELDLQQFTTDAERIASLTDFFRFMETMADLIGCRPSLARLLVREPRTGLKVLFGPLSSAQYRLVGPGADPVGARAAIRRMPTMPWPVLAYELILFFGCRVAGLNQGWGRRSRVHAPVGQRPAGARKWLRSRTKAAGG